MWPHSTSIGYFEQSSLQRLMSNSTSEQELSGGILPIPVLLMLTSLSATLEVLLMVGVGMFLFYKKIIQESHVRVLSLMVFQLFTPCMLSYKFATSVNMQMLKTSYLAIVFAFIYVFAANILSRIVFIERLWRGRLEGVKGVVAKVAVTFNNAGSLPYVFVSALCKTGGLFPDSKLASDQAIAYISLYLLPVQIFFWSYGMVALRKKRSDNDSSDQVALKGSSDDIIEDNDTELVDEDQLRDDDDTTSKKDSTIVDVAESSEILEEEDTADMNMNQTKRPLMERIKAKLRDFRQNLPPLKQVVTPPIYGCIAGIIVALIPYAKDFLITSPPVIVASISHVTQLFGDAVFPLSMILLGANLASTMQSAAPSLQGESDEDKEEKVRNQSFIRRFIKHNDPLVVLAAVVTRLMIIPLFGVGLTLLFVYLKFLPADPVLILVLMVEASTPTAINTSILCTLNDNNGIYQMCELLLFMYLSSPITLSILSTGYLYLACYFSPGKCNF